MEHDRIYIVEKRAFSKIKDYVRTNRYENTSTEKSYLVVHNEYPMSKIWIGKKSIGEIQNFGP